MSLVALAHLFVTLARTRLKKVRELTLDRAIRLLEAAFEEPEMRLARATALVGYYVEPNKVARSSHETIWKKKHKCVKYLLL